MPEVFGPESVIKGFSGKPRIFQMECFIRHALLRVLSAPMVPRRFEYYAPTSLEEAARLLSEHRGEAKLLAGGMSLIPLMKMRLASPGHVVDINRIGGLEYIRES